MVSSLTDLIFLSQLHSFIKTDCSFGILLLILLCAAQLIVKITYETAISQICNVYSTPDTKHNKISQKHYLFPAPYFLCFTALFSSENVTTKTAGLIGS